MDNYSAADSWNGLSALEDVLEPSFPGALLQAGTGALGAKPPTIAPWNGVRRNRILQSLAARGENCIFHKSDSLGR